MAGYTRQSIADIINGSEVTAPPLTAEFNQIAAAFQSATGHSHDGTSGNAPKINLATSLTGYLPAVHGGTGGKNNITAVTDPTVTDDATDGYAPMSMWENTTTGRVFICVGNTSNAAVWRELVQVQTGNVIQPALHDTVDIGSPTVRFQDAWLSGGLSAYGNGSFGGSLSVSGNTTVTGALGVTGDLTAVNLTATGTTAINAGTINGTSIGGTTPSTGAFTTVSTTGKATLATADINGGTIDGAVIGAAARAAGNFTTVNSNAGITGNVTGNLTGNVTGAVTGNVTGNLTGNVTSSGASTFANADINGGSIDGTPIGGAAASTVRGTTVTATTGFVGNVTGNITGNTTGTHTGNVTSASGTSTFNNLTVNGSVDVTNAVVQNVASPTIGTDAANKSYVDAQIASTIDAAPGTLNTLNELAAALGDNPNFATTVTNSIATKVSKAGDSMTGTLSMSGNKVTGLSDPTTGTDAVTKNYVDTVYGSVLSAAASAVAADSSATSAYNDRIVVQSVYDTFDDRYLGAKSSDPALDNDGNALLTGALYFDNTNNITKVYNGTEWQAASSSIEGIKSSFLYTASASQTAFSGVDSNGSTLVVDKAGLVNVFLNGVRLIQDSDYTINASTDVVTLTTGAAAGDTLEVEVFGNFAGQSGADVAITGGLIDGAVIGGTTPAAGSFTQANFGDNDKAIFGAGSDLQIYHDGTNSFIADEGTGSLYIRGSSQLRVETPTGENMAIFNDNGGVSLRYDNVKKFETTATGIDVTGTVTADGLTVDNISVDGNTISSTTGALAVEAAGTFTLDTNLVERFRVASNGDISFYEDTGAQAKFFWDASTERLGIGEAAPATLLHLSANNAGITTAGTGNNTLRFEDNDPTKVQGQVTGTIDWYTNDTDATGVQAWITGDSTNVGAGALAFGTGVAGATAERLRIDSSGKVGIGTAAPSARLDVLSSGTTAETVAQFGNANIAGGLSVETNGNLEWGFNTLNSRSMTFSTNQTERIRVDASGNVGIGTSSPSVALDVVGRFFVGATGGSSIPAQFSTGAGSSTLSFVDTGTTANQVRIGSNGGNLIAMTGGATRMTIDSSGNVLVGKFSANFATTGIQLRPADGSSFTQDGVQPLSLNRLTSDGDILKLFKDGAPVGSIGSDGGDLLIGPANTTDSIRIGPTGEVALLGANNNTWVGFSGTPLGGGGRRCQLWQTQGDPTGRPSMLLESHSGGGPLGVNSTFDDTSNRDVVRIYRRGVQVGSISGTSSATSYNTSSDYRLKENITPVQGAADIVKAMRPVTYTFKSDGSWHDGFLAHELQELHPRAVVGEKDAMKDEEYEVTPAVEATYDAEGVELTPAVPAVMGTRSVPDYQGVDYSKLTPILTAALQEALNKIDALEAQNAAFEARLTALEATP